MEANPQTIRMEDAGAAAEDATGSGDAVRSHLTNSRRMRSRLKRLSVMETIYATLIGAIRRGQRVEINLDNMVGYMVVCFYNV